MDPTGSETRSEQDEHGRAEPEQAGPAGAGPGGTGRHLPPPLKYGLAGLAALGLAVLAVALLGGRGGDQRAAAELDELGFVYQDGTTGTLADFGGEPVVVNFFAAWCAPCRAEIPDIEAVHQAAGERLQIVGISHDLDESSWRSFVAETGLTYPTAFQPGQEIWSALGLVGMPSTILIDAGGNVVHSHTGRLDEPALLDLIGEHLGLEIS